MDQVESVPTEHVVIPDNAQATRDSLGRFLPGVCTNPGGRPKTRHIIEALRERAEDKADEIAARLVDIGTNGKPALALRANEVIMDRLYGKPLMHIRTENTVDGDTARKLSSLASMLLASSSPLPVLEAEIITPTPDGVTAQPAQDEPIESST